MDSEIDLWLMAESTIPVNTADGLIWRLTKLYIDLYLEHLIPNHHFSLQCRHYLYARDIRAKSNKNCNKYPGNGAGALAEAKPLAV